MPDKEVDEEASLRDGNVLIQLPGRTGFAHPVAYRPETVAALSAAKEAHAQADQAIAAAAEDADALRAARAALRAAADGAALAVHVAEASEALELRAAAAEACE